MRSQGPHNFTGKETEMSFNSPSCADTLSTENDANSIARKQPRHPFDQQRAVPNSNSAAGAAYKQTAPSEDQRVVRRGMVKLIEKKLAQTIKQEDSPLPKLAEALEQHLYKTAPSFREHADSKTLGSRIRLVTVALLQRRAKKNQKLTRGDVLKQVLGKERCLEAAELVQEVKMMRLQRLSRDCPNCNDGSFSISDGNNPIFEAQESVPVPVRSLFFNTALVQAFETTPPERIPQLEWETMMDEARLNVQNYKMWDQEYNSR